MKAAVASFVIYLFPLALPHAIPMYGVSLVLGLGRRDLAWAVIDLGIALAAQIAAFAAFTMFFRRPSFWRGATTAFALAVLWAAVQWVHLLAIPRAFLVEANDSPDIGRWREACVLRQHGLAGAVIPTQPDAETPVLARRVDGRLALVDRDSCRADDVQVPPGVTLEPLAVTPAGAALFQGHTRSDAELTWWHTPSLPDAPRLLPRPSGVRSTDGRPALSPDGQWIGWMRRQQIAGAIDHAVVRQSTVTLDIEVTSLVQVGAGSLEIAGIDAQAAELLIVVDGTRLVAVGFDGQTRRAGAVPGGIRSAVGSLLLTEAGWVAWDSYRENEPYGVAWQLGAIARVHRAARGHAIDSVAISANRALIAISTSTQYSFGGIRDAIYVLRATDGEEVFRRSLPPLTRTPVVFAGTDKFLYSDAEGIHVLQMVD